MNRRDFLHNAGLFCGSCALASCQQGILKPLGVNSLVSDSQIRQMSLQAWEETRKQTPLSKNRGHQRRVENIGRRIVEANGFTQQEEWEFRVFESEQVNAFALAGGKVGVNEGLLALAGKDDDQVAAVIGHEIGHVVARHPAQRYSNMMAAGLLASAVQIGALQTRGGQQNQELISQVFGTGLTLGAVLPFSRTQEFEADELGVRFMDMAKYDMEGALRFWQASMSKGRGNTAEFMSTHPSDGNRLARLHYVIEQQRLWSMAGRAAL